MSNLTPPTPMLRLDWRNILFLAGTTLAAIASLTWFLAHGGIMWQTLVLSGAMLVACGLGITTGYHRCLSHSTFEAHWLVRAVLLCFGAASFENSAVHWCSDHRVHHQHTDRDKDPYNIQKGFWHAHIGWIFYREDPQLPRTNIDDLLADPIVRWQDRYFYLIAPLVGFLLPAVIALSWGDFWGGLWIAGVTRLVVNHHTTFCINSFCHWIGNQPYSTKNSARDSWLLALVTYGEGYHNFHHAFPGDYRNGIRAWHFDPSKWIVWGLAKLGLATNLQRIPAERIVFARLRLQEQRAAEKLARRPHPWLNPELLAAGRKQVERAFASYAELCGHYRTFKHNRAARLQLTAQQWREQLQQLKIQVRSAQRSFRDLRGQWLLTVKCASAWQSAPVAS